MSSCIDRLAVSVFPSTDLHLEWRHGGGTESSDRLQQCRQQCCKWDQTSALIVLVSDWRTKYHCYTFMINEAKTMVYLINNSGHVGIKWWRSWVSKSHRPIQLCEFVQINLFKLQILQPFHRDYKNNLGDCL